MSIPVAKAYVTKDGRVISMLDSLEEDIKCKLILTESGVQKVCGRCSKQNRLDFLNKALELSKQTDHGYSEQEVLLYINKAIEIENK